MMRVPKPEGPALILKAAHFAARRHGAQRRKGSDGSPYINHPLEVAAVLATAGRIDDPVILAAALLHDTLEDTSTEAKELEDLFGREVRLLVEDVSDDKSLPRNIRREQQVVRARSYCKGARLVRIADKISNVRDVTAHPPEGWAKERKREYIEWAARVVANCRGTSDPLEKLFDETLARAQHALAGFED